MNPFRRSQTPSDGPDRHRMTLDLIEEVADLRGKVRSIQVEWDDIRVQIRKGYQRMEKAYDRLEPKVVDAPDRADEANGPEPVGFAKKLAEIRRLG